MFDSVVPEMATGDASMHKLYASHLNHKVLDSLIIDIWKGYTSYAALKLW